MADKIQVIQLDSEIGPIVGVSVVAHENLQFSTPATVSDGHSTLDVPMRFYRGGLNTIRVELHKIVDDAIDALLGN